MLHEPGGVNIINNQLFMCDRGNDRIVVFSTELELIRGFGTNGSGDEQFYHPQFIVKDGEDQLWITDFNNHGLCVFTADGKYQQSVVKPVDHARGSSFRYNILPVTLCMCLSIVDIVCLFSQLVMYIWWAWQRRV